MSTRRDSIARELATREIEALSEELDEAYRRNREQTIELDRWRTRAIGLRVKLGLSPWFDEPTTKTRKVAKRGRR